MDRNNSFLTDSLQVKSGFPDREQAIRYITQLPSLLKARGYITASIDSTRFDSTAASVIIYIGKRYYWKHLELGPEVISYLEMMNLNRRNLQGQDLQMEQWLTIQQQMLDHFENTGYPFARIYFDSLSMQDEAVSGKLEVTKGPLYHIDSIRVYGDVKISNRFLQYYLDLPDKSIYQKKKLLDISRRLRELSFLEESRPWDLSLLGTGSVLNLHLKPRRSSQVNLLIGLLPNNDQLSSKKMLITGEANLNLRNALAQGETIELNWQQLQVQSQRLHLGYKHPYIFSSPLGIDFSFDMLRKDSSYLNLDLQAGLRYLVSADQSIKLFLHRYQSVLSEGGLNLPLVIATRQLPPVADVGSTSLGIDYQLNKTNYRLNPRKGWETFLLASTGIKKTRKNNEILSLKDPGDPSFDFDDLYDTVKLRTYQLRSQGYLGRYLPLGGASVLKTAVNAGLLLSGQIYRNELFQIGGYKLLRGFDEESQYLSRYGFLTLEYRYLFGNSYFFAFTDGGWGGNFSNYTRYSHTYLGTGLGLTLETGTSLFTIAWAVGRRNDVPFNLRQSKIHLGFVNYF